MRIIKAPNVKEDRPFQVVEPDKFLRFVEDEAAEILATAHREAAAVQAAAYQEREQILGNARQEAERILSLAKTDAEIIKEEARAQGQEEGRAAGIAEARNRAAALLQELQGMLVQGKQILEGMFQSQESEIRTLVAEIVSRVVQLHIDADNEVVVRVAKACIQMAADRQSLRLLVHPEDRVKIEAWAPHFSRIFDDIEKITIDSDPRVQRGGILIESGTGGIDGRIDKQLDLLNQTLLNP